MASELRALTFEILRRAHALFVVAREELPGLSGQSGIAILANPVIRRIESHTQPLLLRADHMASTKRKIGAAITLTMAVIASGTVARASDLRVVAYAHIDSFRPDFAETYVTIEPSPAGCVASPGDEMECSDGE